jgi:thioredoxin reductase (NADPH)
MSSLLIQDVLIIGAGPAGLTAAIYAGRAGLRSVVIEGEQVSNTDGPGGQLMTTTSVENFPGFPEGIEGPALITGMRGQAERYGASLVHGRVESVNFGVSPFEIRLGDRVYQSSAVIVATGARPLMLGLPAEQRLLGLGVSTCATCDGFFFRNKHIAVIGGGDSALEEALYLSRFAATVTVVHRRDELRASMIMQQRAFENEKITFRWNSKVADIVGDSKVECLELIDVVTAEVSRLPVSGVFIAIGHKPSSELFAGQLVLDPDGYVVTSNGVVTNIAGVFACGDVQDRQFKQAVTAAGSGCAAAIAAERWLSHQATLCRSS